MNELDPSDSVPEINGRLIAVFGISGVGKTTLIDRFIRTHRNWQPLSASSLLVKLTGQDSHELRALDRQRIECNQSALIEAVCRQRTAEPGSNWLLDAHSVIDNGSEWVIVPLQVIAHINLDGLIFVHDDPLKILARRAADPQRLRPLSSLKRVEEEQTVAVQTCEMYSTQLRLRLHRIEADDFLEFSETIARTKAGARSTQ